MKFVITHNEVNVLVQYLLDKYISLIVKDVLSGKKEACWDAEYFVLVTSGLYKLASVTGSIKLT